MIVVRIIWETKKRMDRRLIGVETLFFLPATLSPRFEHHDSLNDMKTIFKKDKFKKQSNSSLTITDALGTDPEPASSTSTIIKITADPMPSAVCSAATAGIPVIHPSSVAVSIQSTITSMALVYSFHRRRESIVAVNQTSHELQVAASASGLGVKGALPAPGVIIQAESGLTKSGLNPLVSLLTPCASRFVDDQPAQHSGLGPFPTQNLLVTGGTFVSLSGGLCVNNFAIIIHRSWPRIIISIISLPILAKHRRRSLYPKNQTPVHCLPDGKIY